MTLADIEEKARILAHEYAVETLTPAGAARLAPSRSARVAAIVFELVAHLQEREQPPADVPEEPKPRLVLLRPIDAEPISKESIDEALAIGAAEAKAARTLTPFDAQATEIEALKERLRMALDLVDEKRGLISDLGRIINDRDAAIARLTEQLRMTRESRDYLQAEVSRHEDTIRADSALREAAVSAEREACAVIADNNGIGGMAGHYIRARSKPAVGERDVKPENIIEPDLDSPPFTPEAAKDFAARGFERVNRHAEPSSADIEYTNGHLSIAGVYVADVPALIATHLADAIERTVEERGRTEYTRGLTDAADEMRTKSKAFSVDGRYEEGQLDALMWAAEHLDARASADRPLNARDGGADPTS